MEVGEKKQTKKNKPRSFNELWTTREKERERVGRSGATDGVTLCLWCCCGWWCYSRVTVVINVPRRTAGATDERRDAQEGGGATQRERERERKRWPSNRKHLKKIPPPTIQNFVVFFFVWFPQRLRLEERGREDREYCMRRRGKKALSIFMVWVAEKGMGR